MQLSLMRTVENAMLAGAALLRNFDQIAKFNHAIRTRHHRPAIAAADQHFLHADAARKSAKLKSLVANFEKPALAVVSEKGIFLMRV